MRSHECWYSRGSFRHFSPAVDVDFSRLFSDTVCQQFLPLGQFANFVAITQHASFGLLTFLWLHQLNSAIETPSFMPEAQ